MLKRLHPLAGLLAMLTILLFWLGTVWSEAFGTVADMVAVKGFIPWGLLVLVLTGASGFKLGGGSSDTRIRAKQRRMKVIAGNGLLILVPCAFYLAVLAARGELGASFYLVQAIELLAGATNLVLMSLNLRDGLRLTGRLTGSAAV